MVSELLEEQAPYDQAFADTLLEDMGDLAVATEADAQGLSRLPLELQISANFIRGTIDYLMMGVENVSLHEFIQVSFHIK